MKRSPWYINFSNTHLCSSLVCSSSRVSLPPSGLPPRLHLLPPADARQTGRAQLPAGRSAMWVAAEPVDAGAVLKAPSCFSLKQFVLSPRQNSTVPMSAALLFMCGQIIVQTPLHTWGAGCAVFWQVCCASDPSVICTGAARGLAVKAAWLHSVVSVCFSKAALGASTAGPACCWGISLSSSLFRVSIKNLVFFTFFLYTVYLLVLGVWLCGCVQHLKEAYGTCT